MNISCAAATALSSLVLKKLAQFQSPPHSVYRHWRNSSVQVRNSKNDNMLGSRGPNTQRGRGGRGGGRGGGGQQRWWDPVWRAERLQQMPQEVEKVDEIEWWRKIEKLKVEEQQEIVIRHNYGREGASILEDMAQQMGLYFHAYNKGRNTVLVASKVPLPNHRADLDGMHGCTQREIQMSTDTERRVEYMLANAKSTSNSQKTVGGSSQCNFTQTSAPIFEEHYSDMESDTKVEKLSIELCSRQQNLKASSAVKVMQSFREKLPAYKMKDELVNAVANNQVLVVSGETGCGKTTQLPQFILEEQIESLHGAQCNIICTQPCRISAISVVG